MNAKRIAKRKEPPALFFQLPSFSSSSISHSHITVPVLLHFFQLRSSFFILLSFFVYFLMIEIHHNFFFHSSLHIDRCLNLIAFMSGLGFLGFIHLKYLIFHLERWQLFVHVFIRFVIVLHF